MILMNRLTRTLRFLGFGLSVLSGRKKLLTAGIPLTDRCNLSCRHCVVKDGSLGHHPFARIEAWMRSLYDEGARILYLQGGEIHLWEDGALRPNDVIRAARKMGYLKVGAVTNGSLPIELDADAVWVSVDGPPAIHDEIRGPGSFETLVRNVTACKHPKLYANLTLNRINAAMIDETLDAISEIRGFKGVSVNFHTPYIGVEHLTLSRDERRVAVAKLLTRGSRGPRILNSATGLRLLASGDYARPIPYVKLVEKGRIYECCWGRDEPEACKLCGYGIIADVTALRRLDPGALLRAATMF